jgi:hypothetical protein
MPRHEDADARPPRTSKAAARQRAFYQDGAWVSIDESHEATYVKDHKLDQVGPQESYYKKLIKRFEALRDALSEHGAPKLAKPEAEISQSSTRRPPSNRHEWLYAIDREYPSMAQVFQLDDRSVRRGLEYCAYALDRFDTISPQKSCWIWTLLALSGDVGTMDSERISCIRELGNKAGEVRNNLNQLQSQISQDQSTCADLAGGAEDEGTKINEPNLCDAKEDIKNMDPGYVRSDKNEPMPETSPKKVVLQSQDDAQLHNHDSNIASVLCDNDERTNIKPNGTALEQARARLLAQLGDNLVQAGIPTSTPSIDEAHLHGNEQSSKDVDRPQEENRKRAIPSRAEAERQRQMMRDSAASSVLAEPPAVAHSVVEDDSSCISDLNTRVTLDMILTVVAECYGQRDLLRFRKPW